VKDFLSLPRFFKFCVVYSAVYPFLLFLFLILIGLGPYISTSLFFILYLALSWVILFFLVEIKDWARILFSALLIMQPLIILVFFLMFILWLFFTGGKNVLLVYLLLLLLLEFYVINKIMEKYFLKNKIVNLFFDRDTDIYFFKNLVKSLLGDVTNKIEKIFIESTFKDFSKRKQFYQLFRETEFFFLGEIIGHNKLANKRSSSIVNNRVVLLSEYFFHNQPRYLFFSSFEKLEKYVQNKKDEAFRKYFKCKFKDFFNKNLYHSFCLNPGFLLSRLFTPFEISCILNENFIDLSNLFPPIKNIQEMYDINKCANKPEDFLKKLMQYFKKNEVIKSIYLAQMNDVVNGLRKIMAFQFKNNDQKKDKIFTEIYEIMYQSFKNERYIEFVELDEKKTIANLVKKHGDRIY